MKKNNKNTTVKNSIKNNISNNTNKPIINKKINQQNFAPSAFSVDIFQKLSNNKLLIGLVAIFVNVGSRYIPINITKNQEALLKKVSTELLIFSITLLMSRDIITAILLTAAFTVLTRYILNENSNLCILPEKYKNVTQLIDTNNDGIISDEEVENAKNLLQRFKEQQQLHNKIFMLNNMQ